MDTDCRSSLGDVPQPQPTKFKVGYRVGVTLGDVPHPTPKKFRVGFRVGVTLGNVSHPTPPQKIQGQIQGWGDIG